ncbi:RICIN domain-containing protein [Streptomyces klenkii]|uniref:RICIN domain-containing protein n=1 Tax=Streptomyces klenkii TaxID=1420899 RepID=UPI0033D3CBC8
MRMSQRLTAVIGTATALGGSLFVATPASAGTASVASDTYYYKNLASGRCLTERNSPYNYTVVRRCDSSASQQWFHEYLGGSFTVRNQFSGQCLETSRGHGGQPWGYPCNGGVGEKWIMRNHGSGRVSFESVSYPGQCLEADPLGRAEEVVLWDCSYAANQLWYS